MHRGGRVWRSPLESRRIRLLSESTPVPERPPAMVDLTLPLPALSPIEGKEIVARLDGGRLSSDGGLLLLREIELHPVSVDTTLSKQEPRGAEGWTKRSKVWMWVLGLWAARASLSRPRCPQPGTRERSEPWLPVSGGAFRASATWCCG